MSLIVKPTMNESGKTLESTEHFAFRGCIGPNAAYSQMGAVEK